MKSNITVNSCYANKDGRETYQVVIGGETLSVEKTEHDQWMYWGGYHTYPVERYSLDEVKSACEQFKASIAGRSIPKYDEWVDELLMLIGDKK